MARIDNIKRIMVEDFDKDDHQLVGKLAEVLNPFMQQIIASYQNKLNFDNLNQQVESFKITVDANGNPINAGSTVIKKQVKLDLIGRVKGLWVINAKNQTDSTNYPTASPFIDFIQNGNLLQINKINGLQTAEEYELTIVIVYDR